MNYRKFAFFGLILSFHVYSSCISASDSQKEANDEERLTKIPRTLIDVAQTFLYFTDESFNKSSNNVADYRSKTHAEVVQKKTRQLLDDILKDDKPYEKAFQDILEKISLLSGNSAFLFITQGKDLISAVIAKEVEAIRKGTLLLWRFSTGLTYDGVDLADLPHIAKKRPAGHLSYSYSILSNYIQDGYRHTEIRCGLTNFSACTFCYWVTHCQGVREEEILRKEISKENKEYMAYLDNLPKHSLYALELTSKDISQLGDALYLPASFQFTQACSGTGEQSHPHISYIKEKPCATLAFLKIFSRLKVIYTNKEITVNQDHVKLQRMRNKYLEILIYKEIEQAVHSFALTQSTIINLIVSYLRFPPDIIFDDTI